MLGPIFLLEWKCASRRSRHRRFRTIYTVLVAAELLVFLFGWLWRTAEWLWLTEPAARAGVTSNSSKKCWSMSSQR